MLKKVLIFIVALIAILIAVYLLGPKPNFSEVDFSIKHLDIALADLDDFVAYRESGLKIKPDNESKIIWADSSKQKTEYAIVYLHGFSASPKEGDPVHLNFAKKYGMNLYTPLLAQHGIEDKESFKTLTPEMLVDDAKEAIAIGKLLGEKVILMSCSTGGTLSIPLCAENPDMVDALVMYSPNFALYDSKAKIISGPWGLQLARKIQGSNYRRIPLPPSCYGYWTMDYRLEGIVALQALIDQSIKKEYFKKIDDPIYAAYYFESEENQDKTISTMAIKEYLKLVSTPKDKIVVESIPSTEAHVMTSSLQSKDIAAVKQALDNFAVSVLELAEK